MVGNLPPAPGEGPSTRPPSGTTQWAPAFPVQPAPRLRAWPAIALAGVAVLLGSVALDVALTRPTGSQTDSAATTSAMPT